MTDNQNPAQRLKSEPRFFYGYTIIIAASLTLLISYGLYGTFGVFFKPLLEEFGWSRATISGAYAMSMTVHGVLGVIMGALNDKLGPRLVVTTCGIFLGAGYLLMSQVNSIWQLYLYYGVIVAIGISGIWVPLMSTIARWFAKRRSVMTGIIVAGAGIGSLIAPPVMNWLIVAFGWRMSYIVIGIVTLLVMVISAQFLIRDPAKKNLQPDGELKTNDSKTVFTHVDTSFTLGKAVRTNQFWLAFLILLSFGYCMVAIKLHIVPHATDIGISPAIAATILAIVGGVSLFGNYVLGSIGDRIGNNRVYVIGAILVVAALVWLIWANETWMFCLIAAIFGFAFGGMASTESPLVADLFGLSSHGLIYGTIGLGFTIGASIGPYVTGYIFDVYGSYWLAFILCAVFAVICILCAALLRPLKK